MSSSRCSKRETVPGKTCAPSRSHRHLGQDVGKAEQDAFIEWRARPTSKRDSDWPGWIKYLGPRPGGVTLLSLEGDWMKKTTSQLAREYVESLGIDQVTRPQKRLLKSLAEHYSDRYEITPMDVEVLCNDLLVSRRHLRRMLGDVKKFIEYVPGAGPGNVGKFRFKEDLKGTQRGHKGDIPTHPN